MKKLLGLFERIHKSEEGAVSLETVLIVGAVALPILIFSIKYGWPTVRDKIFAKGMNDLQDNYDATSGQGTLK